MRKLTVAIVMTLLVGCSAAKANNQIASSVAVSPQTITQVSSLVAQVPVLGQQSNGGELGAGWVPIVIGDKPMVDSSNNQYFWHPPSFKRDGNQVTYLAATVFNNLDFNKPKISLGQMTANCQTRIFHAISGTVYSPSGQVMATVSNTPEAIAQPGSVDEVALMNICSARQTITQADLVRIQLEQLSRARQTNADMINQSIRAGASLFR